MCGYIGSQGQRAAGRPCSECDSFSLPELLPSFFIILFSNGRLLLLIMSGTPRKVPRIMAKSARAVKTSTVISSSKSDGIEASGNIPIPTNELDDDHEQLLVRDGVVVGLQQPNGHFVDETGVQVPTSVVHTGTPRTRRIVIESSIENSGELEPYIPTALPGVADEVESYPCPLCPDRVFLTSFGLEKHAMEKHQNHLQQILEHIEAISAEWRRREEELARRRERVYAARLRQETITRHAIEQVSNGTLGTFPACAASAESIAAVGDAAEGERRFKACGLCGILVDADSPAAMESHLRAHKKNDDLKLKLLARYGPEEVDRLMCSECNMVFGDECSLIVHNQQMHTRRRKYVCKWCGHVAYTMTELNIHKADVHAMPPYTARSDRDRFLKKRQNLLSRGLIALGANPRSNEIDDRHGSSTSYADDFSFRTTCEQCGLKLVRPSLLIRHMIRVHSRRAFSCKIEAPGYSNYRIDVDSDRIFWTCCNTPFTNRRDFYTHRVSDHIAKLAEGDGDSTVEYQTYEESPHPHGALTPGAGVCVESADGTSYMGRIETGPDGTMQVVVPQDVMNGSSDFYVVIDDDVSLDREAQHFKPVENQSISDSNQAQDLSMQQDDASSASSHLLEEILEEGPVDESEAQVIAITEEQYEQLRLQYGDNLENMSVIYVDDSDVGKNEMVVDVNDSAIHSTSVLQS
ncbi:unnamed protein product [Cylicocyclus nassatus]|uniref:C2H2-type domain-containing protein n=1 Tax=Cylicocyclus nassatus TaxID=53992 RepID=A0AA36MBA9_CYLNA|nr:unnamed protein product [Cylicocyclus nassatus]